ncbi:MAG: Holliday junction resolvase RuvX [Nevskiales bacterium]
MRTGATQADGILLGFDFGTRRIGVAVGSRRLGSARALTTLNCTKEPDWDAVAQLIGEWQPEALVVGVPLTLDGKTQSATAGAQRFIRQLQARYGLPVHAADERMSSMEAQSQLRTRRASGQRRRRVQEGDIDSTAAKLILEHWLSEQ